jgi:CspA family cold shock protein
VRDDALDIRRPELEGVRRSGTVRWFKDEKGYGRITADDGEVLFFHFAHIELEGYRALDAGQRVTFVWNGGIQDHGRHRAESVRPASA